jgi:hypothetical protein
MRFLRNFDQNQKSDLADKNQIFFCVFYSIFKMLVKPRNFYNQNTC